MGTAAPRGFRLLDARERQLSWAVALVTVAAPVAIGGAHPLTQVVLGGAALALFGLYFAMRGGRPLRPVPYATVAILALGFTVLQVVPLPGSLVAWLSPRSYEIHAGVDLAARWMPVSVDAPATWLACARGIGCLALLQLVGGFVNSRRRATRLLTVVAATAGAIALTAIVQRLVGASSILGFYRPRSQPGFGVFGTFVNVNHAASMLGLGALVAAGLAVEAAGRQRALFTILSIVSTTAVLSTASRGGLFALALAGSLFAVVLTARSIGIGRALVAAATVVTVVAVATFSANSDLRHRLADPTALVHNQKTRGWVEGLEAATAYRWTGAGRGAFGAAIGAFRTNDEGVRLVYPENIVVQMAAEWGIPFTLLVMAMIIVTTARLAPAVVRSSPSLLAGACGVFFVVVHDLTDFGLEFPGVAFPTVVILGVVVGRIGDAKRDEVPRAARYSLWLVAGAAVAVSIVFGISAFHSRHSSDADFARLHAAVDNHTLDEAALHAAILRHPADDYLELLAAKVSFEQKRPDALRHVNRALLLHPTNWQAHRLAALILMSIDRPAQAALEYRLALENGMSFDVRELVRVLRMHVVEAVPQTPARLIALAQVLYAMNMRREADAAAKRAVDLSDSREALLIERTQLALDRDSRDALRPAVNELLVGAESVDAFVLAARALSRLGDHARAQTAVRDGLRRYPNNVALQLVAIDVRLAAADVDAAREMLKHLGMSDLTLPERQHAEDLLAQVADRTGDVEGAALARARSRLIAKQLQDMTMAGSSNR